jgi:cell division protein ZapA (FtsZ GTPase activity inhibitor)
VLSATKVAILAAMNIADELHKALRSQASWQRMVDDRAGELARFLEGKANE